MKIIEGENYCIYLKRHSLVLETESTDLSMGWFEDESLAIIKLGVLELKEDYPSDGDFRMNVLHIQVMRFVFSFSVEWEKTECTIEVESQYSLHRQKRRGDIKKKEHYDTSNK